MDYNQIYFTEYDEKIVGESKRDPLGLQPIWSYFGSRVIKNITTVSNDLRGFREVLLCLAICGEYQQLHGGLLKEYILLFEQLFIYSMIEVNDSEGIIGGENGTRRYYSRSARNPYISGNPNDEVGTILASEISLGYYGRYKTPLMNMGIIDQSSHIKPLSVDVRSLYGECYTDVSQAFGRFARRQNHRWNSFEPEGRVALRKAVCGKFREHEEEFWLKKLKNYDEKEKKCDELMEECFKLLPSKLSESDYASWLDFYYKLYESTNDPKVQEVINLELYIACVENVFYDMLNSRTINDVSIDNIDYFKRCYDNIKELSMISSPDMNNRFQELIKQCNPYEDVIRGVCKYHQFVSKQKKSSMWLEIGEENDIHTFNPDRIGDNSDMKRRNYYAAPLQSIKEGFEEAKNGRY